MVTLDHLVFGALSLEDGRAWMEARLGVCAQGGGDHAGFGTHNALWRLGDAYLEVIAPDPDAPPPARPRLFGLDRPETRARLAHGPAPIAWVAATDALDATLARLPFPLGAPVAMRRGALAWRLTAPEDGAPPFDGLVPALIAWPPGVHPIREMCDPGLRLLRLAAITPDPPGLSAALAALGAPDLIAVEKGPAPRLSCEIATPDGGTERF
jgi:hypothetical protein